MGTRASQWPTAKDCQTCHGAYIFPVICESFLAFMKIWFLTQTIKIGEIIASSRLTLKYFIFVTLFMIYFCFIYLDMTPEQYANHIILPGTWGGHLELCILSRLLNIQINVVYTDGRPTCCIGEENSCKEKILVFYNGYHYDSLLWNNRQTRFDVDNQLVEAQALSLATLR